MANRHTGRQTQIGAQPPGQARRQRKQQYTTATYSARLPCEDARLVDEYAALHKLERSAVIRLAVRQFTLRQQMKVTVPDPLAKLVEEAVARQVAPLQQTLAHLQPLLSHLFQNLIDRLCQNR